MSPYIEYRFTVTQTEPWREILIARLMELGFDSFNEIHSGLLAYIPNEVSETEIQEILEGFPEGTIGFEGKDALPNVNWNAEWEKNFPPILVEDKVYIRAEFHEPKSELHEIVIQPKMSFGTGHHPTTYLMIQQMLGMDFTGKNVLDMGCGTSVLAIFAKQRGATKVLAIDIDEWSVENSMENAERNHVEIEVHQGTAENLDSENFDIILANINRNILLEDIPKYIEVLHTGGNLLLSGLCFFDVQDILKVCEAHQLKLQKQIQREEWVSLLLEK